LPLNILDFEQFSIETNKLENRTQQLLKNQKITLQPGEQLLNLRVALADYVTGADAKYAYRIAGFQDFWLEDRENLVRISGLPYGNYNLEIRGRLANGQYSSQEIHFPIQVLKPFYLKTGFLVLSLLFLLIIGPTFYIWRNSQLKKRQLELEGVVEERTLEQLLDKQLADADFSIDNLPAQLAMSRSQFFRQMKQSAGLTPNQYLREMRLQKARKLMEDRQCRTLKEVGYAVGFQKVAYFSKLFKKRFGKNPSEHLSLQ